MSPTSSTTIDSTVAKTGRRMQVSGSVTGRSTLGLRRVGFADRDARVGRRAGDGHGHALAQLGDSRGDDHVIGGQTVHDLDLALFPLADVDLLPRGLAVDHLVDE